MVASEAELRGELERLAALLTPAVEWTKRVDALLRLEGLAKGGAATWPAFPELLAGLRDALTAQVVGRYPCTIDVGRSYLPGLQNLSMLVYNSLATLHPSPAHRCWSGGRRCRGRRAMQWASWPLRAAPGLSRWQCTCCRWCSKRLPWASRCVFPAKCESAHLAFLGIYSPGHKAMHIALPYFTCTSCALQVVSEAADACAHAMLAACPSHRLLPKLCSVVYSDRNGRLRQSAAEFLLHAVEGWDPAECERQLDAVERAVLAAAADAQAETRAVGRCLFGAYASAWPAAAQAALMRLERDKQLQDKLAAAAADYVPGGWPAIAAAAVGLHCLCLSRMLGIHLTHVKNVFAPRCSMVQGCCPKGPLFRSHPAGGHRWATAGPPLPVACPAHPRCLQLWAPSNW